MRCRALPLKSTSRPKAACIQAVPRDISWSPVPSARARYELVLSPLSLASIVTLSGSHVFPGEIVAMSGLGSAPAVAMMVAGRWDPTLAALRVTYWMCAPGWAPAHSVRNQICRRGVHALRRSMVLKHAPRVPPCFKTASQVQPWPRQPWLWYRTRAGTDANKTLTKRYIFRGSVRPRRAPNRKPPTPPVSPHVCFIFHNRRATGIRLS